MSLAVYALLLIVTIAAATSPCLDIDELLGRCSKTRTDRILTIVSLINTVSGGSNCVDPITFAIARADYAGYGCNLVLDGINNCPLNEGGQLCITNMVSDTCDCMVKCSELDCAQSLVDALG